MPELNAPTSPEEREGIRELHEWFIRRYPTPLERLAWVRRAIRWPLSAGAHGER